MDSNDLRAELFERLQGLVTAVQKATARTQVPSVTVPPCPGGEGGTDTVDCSLYFEIVSKSNDDKQEVTGVVLQSEVTDAQGDIIGDDVVENASHRFVAGYNKTTKLGFQHKTFVDGRFLLYESWLTPLEMAIGSRLVKKGSWIMTVKVVSKADWKLVKSGKIKGFSIGGKARVRMLAQGPDQKGGQ